MSFVEAHYHPFLFTTMLLLALAELCLTAFMINSENENSSFPSGRYQAVLIAFCFISSWTTLFSATYMLWFFDRAGHILANIASSVAWMLVTSMLWGVASGVMHVTRPGGNCARQPTISRCRQSLTVEAIGWAQCGVCCTTMFATGFWMYASRRVSKQAAMDSADRLV